MLQKGDVFSGKYFQGRIEVESVSEETNELFVDLRLNEKNMNWTETWNLQHTLWGLECGDYFFIPCKTCGEYDENCEECGGDGNSRMLEYTKTKQVIGVVESIGEEYKRYHKPYMDALDFAPFLITNSYTKFDLDEPYQKKLKRGTYEPIRTEPKINRNEPCPCGSGKKFKKCCNN